MTNLEIIITEGLIQGILTPEQVNATLQDGLDLPLHTFAEWKRLGFAVKKGEKAKMSTMIWKWTNKSKKADETTDTDAPECATGHFYMSKAHFFTSEQVERITAKEAESNA